MNKKEPLAPHLKVFVNLHPRPNKQTVHVLKEGNSIRINLVNDPYKYVYLLKRDWLTGTGSQYAFFRSFDPVLSYKEIIKGMNYSHLGYDFKYGDIGDFLDEYKDRIPKVVLDVFLFNLEVFR